jgi:hypothetical protein
VSQTIGDKFAVEDVEIKETPEERSERTRRVTKSAHAPTWAFSSNV